MTSVLFVCIGNACRSQMAEGWLKHFTAEQGREDIEVFSAGSSPMGSIPDETKAVMLEEGIDISEQWSKSVDDLARRDFDYVISLCGDRCPAVPTLKHIDWTIEDPIGQAIEVYRAVREELRERVKTLLDSL